jgi:hypothetical protein
VSGFFTRFKKANTRLAMCHIIQSGGLKKPFNQTPRGADESTLLYSLMQTAVTNNLEPFDYLKFLFT